MKRFVLAVVAVVAFSAASYSQGARFGVKLGANLNQIDGHTFDDGFDLSYHLGGFAELDFNKKWGIQPELLWSQTTGRTSSFNTLYPDLVNPNGSEKFKLNYLSIPILLRYNVGSLVSLNAGPQFSVLLNDDKTLLESGQSAFKNGDLAMVLGAQLNFSFLRVYGRYNIGLNNINDIDSKEKWKSQQIQLGIGLKL
jgi:hypothetical protein